MKRMYSSVLLNQPSKALMEYNLIDNYVVLDRGEVKMGDGDSFSVSVTSNGALGDD